MHALSYAAKSRMRLHAFSKEDKVNSIERKFLKIDLRVTVAALVDSVH